MAEDDCQCRARHAVLPTRKPNDERTVPKFWPNTVTELQPVKAEGFDTTAEIVCASKVIDDDSSECIRSIVTDKPAEPYELTDLHFKDEEDIHMDTWQLPKRIPTEQLSGTHEACSQTGLVEESRAFTVESEEPKDAPEIKMKVFPVVGTFCP